MEKKSVLKKGENAMKLRAKVLILIVAALITFIGFNTMVTASSVDKMIIVGHKAGYHIIANFVSAGDAVGKVAPKV
jgi:hypothetical protein